MNELALKICKQYIDGLVEALEAKADLRARLKFEAPPGFLTDVNDTLDLPYVERDGKRLVDIFLADVKDAGGTVRANSGLPGQLLPGFELPEAFKRHGEVFQVEGKPFQDWRSAPAIVLDNEESMTNVANARGGVGIDPNDPDFIEFLVSWHDLKAEMDEAAWEKQRAELLGPLLSQS